LRCLSATVWAVIWGLSWGSARAQPRVSGIHLEVVHAEDTVGCPSEGEMSRAVAVSLGYDPFVPLGQADRVLSASFDLSPAGITTTLTLRTRDGKALGEQRLVFGGSSCREAAAGAELAITMAVDPPSSIDSGFTPPVQTAPLPAVAAPDAGSQGIEASVEPPPPSNDGPGFEASIGALLSYQSSPRLAVGFTAGFGLRWSHASVDLEARADLPTETAVSGGGSVRSALIFGTLAPCLRSGWFGGCGLLGAGIDQASGQGLSPSAHAVAPYLALGARAFADLELTGALRLQPRLDLWFPASRTTLTVEGAATWVTPPVSLALGVVLVVEWR
jgi:hypothetical protein